MKIKSLLIVICLFFSFNLIAQTDFKDYIFMKNNVEKVIKNQTKKFTSSVYDKENNLVWQVKKGNFIFAYVFKMENNKYYCIPSKKLYNDDADIQVNYFRNASVLDWDRNVIVFLAYHPLIWN